MKIVEWDYYNKLSCNEKLKLLRDSWDIEENSLIGQINYKNLERGFFFIKPFNLCFEPIYFPYSYNKDMIEGVIGFIKENKNIENLNEDDDILVLFKFELNLEPEREQERPIKVKPGSIKILGSYFDYIRDKGLGSYKSNFNKNILTEDFKDKLYFVEDLNNLYIQYEEDLMDDINKKNNDLSEIYKANKVEKIKLESQQKEISVLEEKILRLRKLGFPVDFKNDENNQENKIVEYATEEMVDHVSYIRKFLRDKENLFYSQDIIDRFYNGIKVKQILLLSGPPGTGKTSLVTGFAKAINAKFKVISVKPNWMDDMDLLGFFNPEKELYDATPFLDFLVQARMDEFESIDNVYIVCLDEMNLANIEYYFSEFISKLELEKPYIELYSQYTYNKLYEKISPIIEKVDNALDGEVDEDYIKLWCEDNSINYSKLKKHRDTWENLKRYPAIFEIPKNIRFVGTLNMDETTKELSPKVLDRSFVIEIIEQNEEDIDYNSEMKPIFLSKADINIDMEKGSLYPRVKKKLKEFNKNYFNDLGVKISNRGFNKIEEYSLFSEMAGLMEIDRIIDYMIASKVLPRINFYKSNEKDKRYLVFIEFLEYVKKNKKNYPISYDKLTRMNGICIDTNIVTFWE